MAVSLRKHCNSVCPAWSALELGSLKPFLMSKSSYAQALRGVGLHTPAQTLAARPRCQGSTHQALAVAAPAGPR